MNQSKRVNTKRIHFLFTIIYATIAFAIIASPLIGVGYETTRQAGALGFTVGISFLFIAVLIVCNKNNEFILDKRIMVVCITCCIISIVCTGYPIGNTGNILIRECPALQIASIDENPNIEILISYQSKDKSLPLDSLKKLHVIIMKYDIDKKMIIRERKMNNKWYKNDDNNNIELNHYHKRDLLCSSHNEKNISTFHFIENEINTIIEEKEEESKILNNNGFIINNQKIAQQTNEAEDAVLLQLRINHICRNEQGFAIFWLSLLATIEVLNLITIFTCAWMLSIK